VLSEKSRRETSAERLNALRVLHDVDADAHVVVHEVYTSVQGESTYAGELCAFVRLTGCHLRCTYCDTAHAFHDGKTRAVNDVVRELLDQNTRLVELTGGEPLLQRGSRRLVTHLIDAGKTVLIETSGAVSVTDIDRRAHLIVDIKTPGSGEHARHTVDLAQLKPAHDEVKFVITSNDDYAFAADIVRAQKIPAGVVTLFSPAAPLFSATVLAERIIADRLPVRFQVQLHKVLWGDQRGV
jgi:7-carboxy-7-deazaguanine synthase